MAFCWQADDGPTLNAGLIALRVLGHVSAAGLITFWKEPSPLPQKKKRKGIRTSIANEPYFFVIFQGRQGVRTPCPPSGSDRWWPNIECWIGRFVILRGSGPVRASTIHWNRIVSRYFFWRYAYRTVRSVHDKLTIQHLVLDIRNEFKNNMCFCTIFPFNCSALISKPFSMLNSWYILFWSSVEQDQLAFENPSDLNIHSFRLCL